MSDTPGLALGEITRGDRRTITFTVTKADGSGPFDLTGHTVRFTVKRYHEDPDDGALIRKDNAALGGVAVTNTVGGQPVVTILPADTAELPSHRATLLWDLQVSTGPTDVQTVAFGTLTVVPDVTRTA